jgi:hypothetical protein
MMVLQLQLPALGPIAPPPGMWGACVALVQCLSLVASDDVKNASDVMLYSKFAAGKEYDNAISSRHGMFRIYVPSLVAAAAAMFVSTATTTSTEESGSVWGYFSGDHPNSSDTMTLVAPLLFLHFLKRTMEVAYLHKYSGTMPATSANFIGVFYTLIVVLMASTALPLQKVSPLLQYIGLSLFTIGQLGNLYHHYLLSTLRPRRPQPTLDHQNGSADATKKPQLLLQRYVAPTGGLFGYVAAPHYFFEVVAWLGMACASQQVNSFLVAACMTNYLVGRAHKTNQWYKEQFPASEWPISRKALVPGIL